MTNERAATITAWLLSLGLWAGAAAGQTGASRTQSADLDPATTDTALAESRSTIERLHRALVEVARPERGLDFDGRFAELKPVVEQTHDLAFIAELTIRRQWATQSAGERSAFVSAFKDLSIATYVTRFAAVHAATFVTRSAEMLDDGRVRVSAEIPRPDQAPVTLEYLLQQDSDTWRIVNILADGVSDLALKRAEYQRLLRAGEDIGGLTTALQREAAELKR
jgi:phospholipid transport system substrate-binding protein